MPNIQPSKGVFRRTGARGVKFDVRYRDPETRRNASKTFAAADYPSVTDALKAANAFKARADDARNRPGESKWVDPHERRTLAAYARTYLDARHHAQRETTRRRCESMLRHHVETTDLGRTSLTSIRAEDLDRWVADRAQHLQPSTLRVLVAFVRSVLAYAVENNRIPAAPRVRLSTSRRRVDDATAKMAVPTTDQVLALAEAMDERERPMVLLQAGTGLRLSELFALRGVDVSIPFRTVAVTAQLAEHGTHRVPCKTDESHRIVPISDETAAVLEAHLAAHPLDDASDYVFRNRVGKPYGHQSYGRTMQRACDRAGLDQRMTSHALRHFYATTLLRAGMSPVAVGRLLGHRDGTLVLRTYGHYMPGDDDLARDAIQVALASEATAPALRAVKGG